MSSDYPFKQIITRAQKGRKAIFPSKDETSRFSVFGADIHGFQKRFHTLDDLLLSAPQFTPYRLEKSYDLIFREPFFKDVDTKVTIGGMKSRLPIVQSSMGSPEDWNSVSTYSAKACAKLGIVYGIGENVATTWGYDKRHVKSQPSFIERITEYFKHAEERVGGVVIQQNEEDAQNELWNRVYSDPQLTKFIHNGQIAFEIKAGQGAKAGIGGEKIVDRETALRLQDKGYIIYPDPQEVEQETYERHSSPDIFTNEILRNRILKLRNDYPRAKIWLKTGPYRDLLDVIRIASEVDIDVISIDGKEGGTGMSPTVALQHLGLPTLACLSVVKLAREEGITTSIIISGRIIEGSQIVKALSLGATAVAMGRPFLIAANSYPFATVFIGKEFYKSKLIKKLARKVYQPSERSVELVIRFIETVELEIQLLASSLGKYSMDLLSSEDLCGINPDLSRALGIDYVFNISNNAYSKFRDQESIIYSP